MPSRRALPRVLFPLSTVAVALLLFSTTELPPTPSPAQAQEPSSKPNLLFILTDDQRIGTMAVMPKTRESFPINFTRGFVTTPVCCPSRASYLTGQYSHTTGVRDNSGYAKLAARHDRTLGPWLKAQGYLTGFFGKYLNRFTTEHVIPPGWDEFSAFVANPDDPHGRVGNGYTSFWMREFRKAPAETDELFWYSDELVPGTYATTVLGDKAVDFIRRVENPALNPDGKPWALFVWPNAPHLPFVIEDQYQGAPVAPFDPPASFMNISGKPSEVANSLYRRRKAEYHRDTRRSQLRMLMSVDDTVGRIFDAIDEAGARDQTWGVYASDNGYSWGEFTLTSKYYGYDHIARVPFRMHVPGEDARTIDTLVTNLDIAPTFARVAGDDAPHGFEGLGLRRLIAGHVREVRDAFLIEGRPYDSGPQYRGIRTTRWKYLYWYATKHRELYDIRNDPLEMRNLASRRPRVVKQLHRRMNGLLNG